MAGWEWAGPVIKVCIPSVHLLNGVNTMTAEHNKSSGKTYRDSQ